MKTRSKVGFGDIIKATAIILGFFTILVGIIIFVPALFNFVNDAYNGWGTETECAHMMTGVIYMLSGWVGGLTLFGFGIIVDAHEDKAASENASGESATSTTPVRPVFKAEDTEKVIPNIDLKNKFGNASNSTPKRTKEGWICPKCNAIHPNHIGSCQNCGEPKPSGSTAPASSSQTPTTVGWRCSHCGSENSKYVSNCVKCGTAKPQS